MTTKIMTSLNRCHDNELAFTIVGFLPFIPNAGMSLLPLLSAVLRSPVFSTQYSHHSRTKAGRRKYYSFTMRRQRSAFYMLSESIHQSGQLESSIYFTALRRALGRNEMAEIIISGDAVTPATSGRGNVRVLLENGRPTNVIVVPSLRCPGPPR